MDMFAPKWGLVLMKSDLDSNVCSVYSSDEHMFSPHGFVMKRVRGPPPPKKKGKSRLYV